MAVGVDEETEIRDLRETEVDLLRFDLQVGFAQPSENQICFHHQLLEGVRPNQYVVYVCESKVKRKSFEYPLDDLGEGGGRTLESEWHTGPAEKAVGTVESGIWLALWIHFQLVESSKQVNSTKPPPPDSTQIVGHISKWPRRKLGTKIETAVINAVPVGSVAFPDDQRVEDPAIVVIAMMDQVLLEQQLAVGTVPVFLCRGSANVRGSTVDLGSRLELDLMLSHVAIAAVERRPNEVAVLMKQVSD
jgi:hypothetical protein